MHRTKARIFMEYRTSLSSSIFIIVSVLFDPIISTIANKPLLDDYLYDKKACRLIRQ